MSIIQELFAVIKVENNSILENINWDIKGLSPYENQKLIEIKAMYININKKLKEAEKYG